VSAAYLKVNNSFSSSKIKCQPFTARRGLTSECKFYQFLSRSFVFKRYKWTYVIDDTARIDCAVADADVHWYSDEPWCV